MKFDGITEMLAINFGKDDARLRALESRLAKLIKKPLLQERITKAEGQIVLAENGPMDATTDFSHFSERVLAQRDGDETILILDRRGVHLDNISYRGIGTGGPLGALDARAGTSHPSTYEREDWSGERTKIRVGQSGAEVLEQETFKLKPGKTWRECEEVNPRHFLAEELDARTTWPAVSVAVGLLNKFLVKNG